MTDETLEQIIAEFNEAFAETRNPPQSSTTRWIAPDVLWGYSWRNYDRWSFDEFYLVRHGDQFAGIVYVMLAGFGCPAQSDLHVLVTEKFRGRRFICPAMRDFIVPHLCSQAICSRPEKVSIFATTDPTREWSDRSKRILENLAFGLTKHEDERDAWEFVGQPQISSDYIAPEPFPPRDAVVRGSLSALDRAELLLQQIKTLFPCIKPEKQDDLVEQLYCFRELTVELLHPTDYQTDPAASKPLAGFPALQSETQNVLQKLSQVARQVEIHSFDATSLLISSWIGSYQEVFWLFENKLKDLLEDVRWEVEPPPRRRGENVSRDELDAK